MRPRTKDAFEALVADLRSAERAYGSEDLAGWSCSADVMARRVGKIATRLEKIVADDAESDRIETEAAGVTVLSNYIRPSGDIEQTVRENATGRTAACGPASTLRT